MRPPEPKRPRFNGVATIKDVAALSKVSIATVSRVLASPDKAGKQARQRVLRAVEQLNYHPNRLARDLRAGLRKVVGVVIPDLQNPFLTEVVQGIEGVLQRDGYTLTLGNSEADAAREQRHLSVMRGEGVAGLILIPSNVREADYTPLRGWDLPLVAVDRMPRGLEVDLVCSSSRDGAREAIEHLIRHGYKDIAIITGPAGVSTAEDRLAGYLDALRAASLAPRHSFIMQSDFRQAGGRTAMWRLLDLARPPRAVFVANNLMALGALQAIHERGLDIPGDIAVVGFDDMPWAASLRPPLTAVAQPAGEIGRVAAQLLLERLHASHAPARQIVLRTQLIVRASCGAHVSAEAHSNEFRKRHKTKKP
jgi:LacI family transcriptional regulator